jgi:protein-glutamine gamma-glutamyltransferase
MISLPGYSYDAIVSEYAAKTLERTILRQLHSSPQVFEYGSVDELQFELGLRCRIVDASQALHHSNMNFEPFEKSIANPRYWRRLNNGGFRLLQGVKPSEAINDIFNQGHLYGTECATALVIVHYKALLEQLGAAKFDAMFPNIYLMNWDVRDQLLSEISSPVSTPRQIIGDRVYFDNPQVSPEVPWWQGENTIVLPDEMYYGHGMGIKPKREVIAELNRQRQETAHQSAFLMPMAARPNIHKLYQASASAAPPMPRTRFQSWQAFPPPIAGSRV